MSVNIILSLWFYITLITVCQLLFVYSQMNPKLKGQISDYFGVTGHTSRVSFLLYLDSVKSLWLRCSFCLIHQYEKMVTVQIYLQLIAVASIRKRKKYVLNGELTLSNVKVCILFTVIVIIYFFSLMQKNGLRFTILSWSEILQSFALDFLGDKLRNQQSKTALSQIQLQQKLLARLPVPDMMTKEAI